MCEYICIHMCVYMYMYRCIYDFLCICKCICLYAFINIYKYIYMFLYLYIYVYIYMCVCVRICVCIYIYNMHTYVLYLYICMYICICVHDMCSFVCVWACQESGRDDTSTAKICWIRHLITSPAGWYARPSKEVILIKLEKKRGNPGKKKEKQTATHWHFFCFQL